MPIRLNLLAEAQAQEELRRRDPVKRAVWAAVLLVALMLAWSSFLQLRAALASSELARVEGQVSSQTNAYRAVLDSQHKTEEMTQKVSALRQLASERLLYGSFLNAFQRTTVDDVQLLHLRADQNYAITEAAKSRTNTSKVVTKGKAATATEKIVVTIEGNDSSASPGDQVNRFKEVLAGDSYFKDMLAKTNAVSLKSLSAPQVSPGSGKPCVVFALECRYLEKTR